jgi:hypothetical protein
MNFTLAWNRPLFVEESHRSCNSGLAGAATRSTCGWSERESESRVGSGRKKAIQDGLWIITPVAPGLIAIILQWHISLFASMSAKWIDNGCDIWTPDTAIFPKFRSKSS